MCKLSVCRFVLPDQIEQARNLWIERIVNQALHRWAGGSIECDM